MKRQTMTLAALLVAGGAPAGCDFLDPTDVTNPTVTEGDFLRTPNAASSWTRGVERQLSTAVNQVVMGAEVASDNLFNNRTLFSRVFDIPEIEATDSDVLNIQRQIQRLREMATQGLEVIAPADPNTTDAIRGQLHFLRGYASLMSGELFVALPGEARGPALPAAEHLSRAVADFQQARSLTTDPDARSAALLGIARAQHRAGNLNEAVAAAQEVRATAPTVIRRARFDVTDGPTNQMQFAIFDSGQDEFQPLPRLDFLFPKYYSRSAGDQSTVVLLKGEEAFLILAEAGIAQGQLAAARSLLVELLGLVAQRPTAMVDDRGQLRGRRGGTWIFPDNANVLVQASPDDPPRTGLVLTRSAGPVEVPVVSGTSVTTTMLDAAATEEALLELLYLMRQEIFMVEGRRMTDLGIRFPVAFDEAVTNTNIQVGSAVLQAQIPQWIPGNRGMNAFTYADGDTLAVIQHNLNRALVQNRSSPMVLPFH